MSASPVVLLLVALIAGGAVAIYMARANKDSVNVGSSEKAVSTLSTALDRLDKDLSDARGELTGALTRIAGLEQELAQTQAALAEQHDVVHECRTRIEHLSEAIVRLGGNVDDSDDVRDGGDRA